MDLGCAIFGISINRKTHLLHMYLERISEGRIRMEFISDYIDLGDAEKSKFNIVASGCGTGKTFWVANNVREQMPFVKPSEILFVTSRALIVEQQSRTKGITKFNPNLLDDVRYWNGEKDNLEQINEKGIQIMTYDKIISIIKNKNAIGFETLSRIKVVFFDECHTIFSDSFIKDMEALKVWIREALYAESKLIIGLTATPGIIFYSQTVWGAKVKQLNKDILVNYRAKQLRCTNFNTLHFLLANGEIQGKTIVMCYSVKDCYTLKKLVPNSFVLVSKSNSNYMPEMEEVRNYIIENESLPDTYMEVTERDNNKRPIKFERRKLNVLISTSTLREGINLRKGSGIKNIVVCFTDELHISQCVGRCRFNIENLIVVDTYIRTDNYNPKSYLAEQRQLFKDYMENRSNTRWFNTIAHLVEHDISKIIFFTLTDKEAKFTKYINTKWLVPDGANQEEIRKRKIYREQDKKEIVDKAIYYQLLAIPRSRITFNRVMRLMEDTLGYVIESGRLWVKRKQHTYKLVIDFDEEVMNKNVKGAS